MFNCVRKIKCHRVWLLFDSVLHFNFARFIRCVRIPQIVPVVTVIIIVEKSCIYGIHDIQTLLTWENTHFPFCFTFFLYLIKIFTLNIRSQYRIVYPCIIMTRTSQQNLYATTAFHRKSVSVYFLVYFSFHFYLFRSFFLNSFPSFFFFLN